MGQILLKCAWRDGEESRFDFNPNIYARAHTHTRAHAHTLTHTPPPGGPKWPPALPAPRTSAPFPHKLLTWVPAHCPRCGPRPGSPEPPPRRPPGCCRRRPTGGRGPRPRPEPGSKRKGKRRRRSGRPRRPSEKGARLVGPEGVPLVGPARSLGTPFGWPTLQGSQLPQGPSAWGRWGDRPVHLRSRRAILGRRGRGPGAVGGQGPPATRLTCC